MNRLFVSLAAMAALTLATPALGDSIAEEELNPCPTGQDCTKKKTGGGTKKTAPAPEPTAQPADNEPPEVVIDDPSGDVEVIFDGGEEPTPAPAAETESENGWLHFGGQLGASGGSWGIPQYVIDDQYHDMFLSGDAFGGGYILFGGHRKGAPFGGVSGAVGLGSIQTRTWRAHLELGHMFSDRFGFGGLAGFREHELDYRLGGFANRTAGGEIGPLARFRIDKPSGGDYASFWVATDLRVGLNDALDTPDLFGNVTAGLALQGGLNFPGKKKAVASDD